MNEKVYVPGATAKEVQGKFGSILKLGFRVEPLLEFIQQNTNENGFINFDVVGRKSAGKYGETHSVILNDWQPQAGSQRRTPAETAARRKPMAEGDGEDVPF